MRVKIRICELESGDKFEMGGLEFKVKSISNDRIFFNRKLLYGHKNIESRGAKSQIFVYKIIGENCRVFNMESGFIRPKAVYSNKSFAV